MSGPDGREGPEGVAPLPAQGYATLTFEAPAERPGIGAAAPDRTPPGGWHLPWDRLGTAEAARVLGQLRAGQYEFHTSGVTGEPVRRVLSGELLAADAAHAARLLAPYAPGAVVSFVPPRHAFGASATMMLPALTGLPVWFWPADDCPPPPVAARRIAVVAIPRTFRALARHPRWTASFEHLVLLHGSAELPPEARRFRDDPRIDLIELLGSTETGAVAHRSGWDPQGAWTLLDDVAFAAPAVGAEGPLTVTGPRLAALPTEAAQRTTRWTTSCTASATGSSCAAAAAPTCSRPTGSGTTWAPSPPGWPPHSPGRTWPACAPPDRGAARRTTSSSPGEAP